MLPGLRLSDKSVFQKILNKPDCCGAVIGHKMATLDLKFCLGVVKVDGECSMIGLVVGTKKDKPDEESRDPGGLVSGFSGFSAGNIDTIGLVTKTTGYCGKGWFGNCLIKAYITLNNYVLATVIDFNVKVFAIGMSEETLDLPLLVEDIPGL